MRRLKAVLRYLSGWIYIAVGAIVAARDDGLNLRSLRRQCWNKVGKEK
jgi:hypothetical protein